MTAARLGRGEVLQRGQRLRRQRLGDAVREVTHVQDVILADGAKYLDAWCTAQKASQSSAEVAALGRVRVIDEELLELVDEEHHAPCS